MSLKDWVRNRRYLLHRPKIIANNGLTRVHALTEASASSFTRTTAKTRLHLLRVGSLIKEVEVAVRTAGRVLLNRKQQLRRRYPRKTVKFRMRTAGTGRNRWSTKTKWRWRGNFKCCRESSPRKSRNTKEKPRRRR